ncbi:MAG: Clp protease ClpP, partial [Gammaproteobacteria bacterium]
DELEDTADLLRKVGDSLASVYSKRTGLPIERIKVLMADETWLNATEAKALGFAD